MSFSRFRSLSHCKFTVTFTLLIAMICSCCNADVFNDLISIEVDDVSAGVPAVAAIYEITPSEFDLELEHSGGGGFDVDINPLGGCDFLLTIAHYAPIDAAPIGVFEWKVHDIHMRDEEGNELFHKITGVEPMPGGAMPTLGTGFTDWMCTVLTGPFASSSAGATNDFVIQVTVNGDVNSDCKIDLLDVGPFVDALSSGDYSLAADINQDGLLNLLDVGHFVALISGS